MKASLPFKYITAVKNGKQYVVFDYKDKAGKRKRKWGKDRSAREVFKETAEC